MWPKLASEGTNRTWWVRAWSLTASRSAGVKGLKPRHLAGAAFGSYGWSGEATAQMEDMLREMQVSVEEGLRVKYVPDGEALSACADLGRRVAEKIEI